MFQKFRELERHLSVFRDNKIFQNNDYLLMSIFFGDIHFLFNDSSLQSACIGAMILYVSDLCNLNT